MAKYKDMILNNEGEQTEQSATPPVAPTQEVERNPKMESVLSEEQKTAANAELDKPIPLNQEKAQENVRKGYDEMLAMVNTKQADEAKRKTAEMEEKRRNRKRIFNAIGDGVAALSNLYFTTKGAPSVKYDPRGSLSARAQARWDAIDTIRNEEADKQYMRDYQAREAELRRAREARLEAQNEALAQYRQEALENRKEIEQIKRDRDWEKLQEQFRQNQAMEEQKQQGRETVAKINATNRANIVQTQEEGKNTRAALGGGSVTPVYLQNGEVINVPKNALNEEINVSRIYNALPDSIKQAAFEKYNLGEYVEKKQLTPTQMRVIVGEYMNHPDAKEVHNILRELENGAQPQPQSRFDKYRVKTASKQDSTKVKPKEYYYKYEIK
jgi:hypothetical protein